MIADTVFLHLGLAKTGTTYLQEYLACNRDILLREHGILYPSGPANHFHFQTILSANPASLIQIRREGFTTNAEVDGFIRDFRDRFEAEMHEKKPEKIIISSEYFSSMSNDEFAGLKNFLKGYGKNQKAIVYMRDPWSHTTSIMQQNIRDGKFAAPLRFGYHSGQVFLIRRNEQIYGDDLIVRPYFGGTDGRTNILDDFSEILKLPPLPHIPETMASVNKGMGRVRTTLIAEFNSLWPQFDENNLYILSYERDKALNSIMELDIEEKPLEISLNKANMILKLSREDMEYIHQSFFLGNTLFFDYYRKQMYRDFDCTISFDCLDRRDLVVFSRAAMSHIARMHYNKTN